MLHREIDHVDDICGNCERDLNCSRVSTKGACPQGCHLHTGFSHSSIRGTLQDQATHRLMMGLCLLPQRRVKLHLANWGLGEERAIERDTIIEWGGRERGRGEDKEGREGKRGTSAMYSRKKHKPVGVDCCSSRI